MKDDKYFEANTDKCLAALIKYSDEHFSMSLESMSTLKMELIWLYTHLEIKADEARVSFEYKNPNKKWGGPSKEYIKSIENVKRASVFISTYCLKLEQMENELQELNRRIKYLESKLPKVSMKDATIVYENGKLIYK